MKWTILVVAGSLVLPMPSFAASDAVVKAAKELDAAMLGEIQKNKPKKGSPTNRGDNMPAIVRAQIVSAVGGGGEAASSENGLTQALSQIGGYFTSDAVLSKAGALQEVVRREIQAQEQAAIEEIQKMLARAGEAVRAAKTTSDLDDVLKELSPIRNRYAPRSEKIQSATAQIETAQQFVAKWQDYLAAEAQGDKQRVPQLLHELSNIKGVAFIPRSEILSRMREASMAKKPEDPRPTSEAAEEILSRTQTLDELGTAIKALRKAESDARTYGSSVERFSALISTLQQMERTYCEFQAGLSVSLEIGSGNYGSGGEFAVADVARLKRQLLLLVLPRYIGAPAGTTPKAGENVQQFLERAVAEARERGDMAVATRGREATRLLQRGSAYGSTDTAGLTAFVSGQNQEIAGQHMLAVISYQNALKSGSDLVPSKLIGDRLAAIKAEHPKEFEQGMEMVLNPPAPRYPPDPRAARFREMPESPSSRSPSLLIPPAPVADPGAAKVSPAPAQQEDTKKPAPAANEPPPTEPKP
ncbi:MAG: hypothetical protein ACR2OZ_17060 [Verrucomicrobiales bacterium]